MIGPFEFEENGKTYRCTIQPAQGQPWWWFQVSGDANRYAPFQAASKDTRESVRARIVSYYANHLAARFAPPPPRGHWSNRKKAAEAPKK